MTGGRGNKMSELLLYIAIGILIMIVINGGDRRKG